MADVRLKRSWQLDPESVRALAHGAHDNPFSVLGPHDTLEGRVNPHFFAGSHKGRRLYAALTVRFHSAGGARQTLFESLIDDRTPYRLRIFWSDAVQDTEDPSSFGLLLGDVDLYLLNEGRRFQAGALSGAHAMTVTASAGVRLAVLSGNCRGRLHGSRFPLLG